MCVSVGEWRETQLPGASIRTQILTHPREWRPKTNLSAYWENGKQHHLTAENTSRALKFAAGALDFPTLKGIPIERVDTHSLRMGGANALALAGYSDTQIQKMGLWRGATFKEYIREELACFSSGMSKDMKRRFNFVGPVDRLECWLSQRFWLRS